MAAAIASRSRQASPIPGDALLHPAAMLSIAVLVVNDHFLKAAWPGIVSGKLSDFAGMFFFPLLLVAIAEVVLSSLLRRPVLSPRHLQVAVGITAVVFIAVKLIPAPNDAASWLLGGSQWLAGVALGSNAHSITPVSIARDPTDLVALPVLALAYIVAVRRYREVTRE